MRNWLHPVLVNLILVFLISAGNAAPSLPGPQYKPTKGNVWPKPLQIKQRNNYYVFNPEHLEFKGEGEKCPLITDSVTRYRIIMQKQARGYFNEVGQFVPMREPSNHKTIREVTLKLYGKCEIYPHADMDESYHLIVNATSDDDPTVKIQSNSVWGMMKGLETFSQLSFFNGTLHQLTIKETGIWDKPRFPHRGLMIDTSRHYLHKKTIKKMIEAMEFNKYNVLHWHITDDQSFPYKSLQFPELSEKGAYRPEKIYAPRDIREIIEYARKRGIRVIPEFDSPGHTQSWGLSQPDFLAKCYSHGKFNGLYGPVDPSVDKNYDFLEQLFDEVTHLFPDSHFHFGGDEVDFTCWMTNPNIREFMVKKGFGIDYPKLESYYVNKVLDIADKLKVSPIVWQEVFTNDRNLSNNILVHIWTGDMQSLLTEVTGSGHKTILSTCWYLDHFANTIYAGGGDWQTFYNCEPLDFPGTDKMKQKVVGGEACMWGEYVDDTNIIQRVWPRACSAAERLWSTEFNITFAANRLEEHVCRMRSRGIMAQPPNGPSTC